MVVNRSTMYFVPFAPIVPLPVNDVRPPVDADVLVMVMFPVEAEELELPAASVNDPDATVTTPVPPDERYGLYATVYEVPLPEKLERLPSVALTSASANVVEDSFSPIDTLTDEPAVTEVGLTVALGAVVSTTIDSAADDALVTPSSVWVAVIDHVPSCRVPRVHDPEESVQVTLLEPAFVAVTVPLAPAVIPATVIVGVESNVMSSDDDAPLSLKLAKSGVLGVDGIAYRSTTIPEPPEPPLPDCAPPPPPPRLVAPLLPAPPAPPLPPTPEPPVVGFGT